MIMGNVATIKFTNDGSMATTSSINPVIRVVLITLEPAIVDPTVPTTETIEARRVFILLINGFSNL